MLILITKIEINEIIYLIKWSQLIKKSFDCLTYGEEASCLNVNDLTSAVLHQQKRSSCIKSTNDHRRLIFRENQLHSKP